MLFRYSNSYRLFKYIWMYIFFMNTHVLTHFYERNNITILMRLDKPNCKVLHQGWDNPRYQYRVGDEGMESSPAAKGIGG